MVMKEFIVEYGLMILFTAMVLSVLGIIINILLKQKKQEPQTDNTSKPDNQTSVPDTSITIVSFKIFAEEVKNYINQNLYKDGKDDAYISNEDTYISTSMTERLKEIKGKGTVLCDTATAKLSNQIIELNGKIAAYAKYGLNTEVAKFKVEKRQLETDIKLIDNIRTMLLNFNTDYIDPLSFVIPDNTDADTASNINSTENNLDNGIDINSNTDSDTDNVSNTDSNTETDSNLNLNPNATPDLEVNLKLNPDLILPLYASYIRGFYAGRNAKLKKEW